jgi:hypothetical protein
MRENRPYGLEGGESGSTGLPYPYRNKHYEPSTAVSSPRLCVSASALSFDARLAVPLVVPA